MKKVVAVIQARMGSQRLLGKVLMDLVGKPALLHLVETLKKATLINEIVIATSTLYEDDAVSNLAVANNIKVVRGSSNDVLDRFRLAVQETKAEVIVRITGDDPLMDFGIIDEVIKAHLEGGWDYTSNILERSYPRGMDTEVINKSVLEDVWKTTSDNDDREHVTLYVRDHPEKYRLCNVKAIGIFLRPELRLCIDTKDDYDFVSKIFKELYKGKSLRLKDVIHFIDSHPEMKQINSGVEQRKVKGKIY